MPISIARAFVLIAKEGYSAGNDIFRYSDEIGQYDLAVGDKEITLICVVRGKSVYSKTYPVDRLLPQDIERIHELRSRTAAANLLKENAVTRLPSKGTLGTGAKSDPASTSAFRAATKARVPVRIRLASDDMRLGGSPGHVGDLK